MIGMMSTAFMYNNRGTASRYYRSPSPITSPSPTLVNDSDAYYTEVTERPSLKLSFPCGASNILNSAVTNAVGRSLYSISSNSKRTTIVSCRDTGNLEVATVQWESWDRQSPRMVFRRRKMKCKEWLRLAGPNNESRTLTHGDAQFTWMQGQGSASGHLIPANRRYRPGLEIAQWQIKAGTDELILEVFQESPVESGLLDAIVLSTVLLRSGHSLGGSQAQLVLANPFYSQTVLGLMGSY